MKSRINIPNLIKSMSRDNLIKLNNLYSDSTNSSDHIYVNDKDFLENHFGSDLHKFSMACRYGNFDAKEAFVRFDGYGNLDTFSQFSYRDLPDFVTEIAEDMLDNPSNYKGLGLDEYIDVDIQIKDLRSKIREFNINNKT